METRLRNLLHDLSTEMPVDAEGSRNRTLRRARGRRVLTAGAGVAIVVALVVVSASALRLVEDPTPTPAVTGPTPVFEGLWPETDAESLAVTQVAVDEGHMPLRTSPEGTASELATNLLGWKFNDVRIETLAMSDDRATVAIDNRLFSQGVPVITVELRRLGDTGPNGIWSVVGVSTPLVELDDPVALSPENPSTMRGRLVVSGRVTDVFDGAPAVEAHVLDGPALVPSLGSTPPIELADRGFDFRMSVEATPDGRATLLLTIPDATGASLGAVMVPVETPVGEAPRSGPNLEGVPPDIAVTAQAIYDAAKTHDLDALAELIDPNTFDYNMEPGTDPIPAWRSDPSQLDRMVAILEMPPTTRDIDGNGTFTFWPYLVNSDFSALSSTERADLATLGYTDEQIQLMIDSGTGYQGPRLAIDEKGNWRNFITVGE